MNAATQTRWQSFRRDYRQRPLKKSVHAIAFVIFISLYGYSFFHYQPDRSYHHVKLWNEVMDRKNQEFATFRKEEKLRKAEKRKQDDTAKVSLRGGYLDQEVGSIATDGLIELQDVGEADIASRENGSFIVYFFQGIWSFLMLVTALRLYIRFCIIPRLQNAAAARQQQQQEFREERFRVWSQNLNRQRRMNGHPMINLSSLRLVMRGRELTGDDYAALLRFNEESGPALESLLNHVGLSQQEIDRLPLRRLSDPMDEVLRRPMSEEDLPLCTICLEPYRLEDEVRSIPCFHYFHKSCIDPWLRQKASCPICKHSASA
jgi:hypothetical protein